MQAIWDILNNPRRVGGVCGIVFVILFIVGGPLLQDSPVAGDPVEEIREFWEDDADTYLVGDYLIFIGIALFFLPFVLALRSLLAGADKSGGIWPGTLLAGALFAVIVGGAGAAAPAALGIGDAPDAIDDSALILATNIGAYSFAGLAFGFALMLLSAAILIGQSRVLWRWLAILAVIIAIVHIIGGLWLIDGDQDSALGAIGAIGLAATLLWTLLAGINLLVRRGEEAPPAAV